MTSSTLKAAIVAGACLASTAGASAQPVAGDPAGGQRFRAVQMAVIQQCRGELGVGVTSDADRAAIKGCVKEKTRPYKKACNKELKAQGLQKKTAEFKDAARACIAAQLAPLYRVSLEPPAHGPSGGSFAVPPRGSAGAVPPREPGPRLPAEATPPRPPAAPVAAVPPRPPGPDVGQAHSPSRDAGHTSPQSPAPADAGLDDMFDDDLD